jgi:hypothetical protein
LKLCADAKQQREIKTKKASPRMRLAFTTTGWVARFYLRFPTSILVAVLVAASKSTFTGAPL